jgi:hypothetical protein
MFGILQASHSVKVAKNHPVAEVRVIVMKMSGHQLEAAAPKLILGHQHAAAMMPQQHALHEHILKIVQLAPAAMMRQFHASVVMMRQQLARPAKLQTHVQLRVIVMRMKLQSAHHEHILKIVQLAPAAMMRQQRVRLVKLRIHVQLRVIDMRMKFLSAHHVLRVMKFSHQNLDYLAKKFLVITMMIPLAQCQKTPMKLH